jgi:ubiquinone/menaquinone biosynthesis C-methylase UbiE
LNLADAIDFIRPAVESASGAWADLGAGRGTFTEALAAILDSKSTILAVDRDRGALKALRNLATRVGPDGRIRVTEGDIQKPAAIPGLATIRPAGVLLGNVLHYIQEPVQTLRTLARLLAPEGRIVIIEYDRRASNQWVPYPLPVPRLLEVAIEAGLTTPSLVARRKSSYQGNMYCAVAFRMRPDCMDALAAHGECTSNVDGRTDS